jgi:hypothetical protein
MSHGVVACCSLTLPKGRPWITDDPTLSRSFSVVTSEHEKQKQCTSPVLNQSLKTEVHKFPAHFLRSICSSADLIILLHYISYSDYTVSNKTQFADCE